MNKQYSNGEVTIRWQPKKCIHSGICMGGLPDVFRPKERPWIDIDAAPTEALIDQVKQCPSGALSFYMNDAEERTTLEPNRIEAIPKGPLMVYGDIEFKDKEGRIENKSKSTAFCRCGSSENKPFCDGSHRKIDFEG